MQAETLGALDAIDNPFILPSGNYTPLRQDMVNYTSHRLSLPLIWVGDGLGHLSRKCCSANKQGQKYDKLSRTYSVLLNPGWLSHATLSHLL